MKYDRTCLPEKVKKYLEEIYNDDNLRDAFLDCDVDIYSADTIKDLEDNSWLEDLSPGKPNYDIKTFACDASGAEWVILNDELIGYIGTEGECGIVARNIDEFMNIVSTFKAGFTKLKDEKSFIEIFKEHNQEFEEKEILDEFISKHNFETNPSKVYELLKLGMTVKPFFVIKAVDDDCEDSDSLFGIDGQKSLEEFIYKYLN